MNFPWSIRCVDGGVGLAMGVAGRWALVVCVTGWLGAGCSTYHAPKGDAGAPPLSLAPATVAAPAPAPAPATPPIVTVECRWAEGPITLDGKAEEAAWGRAEVLSNFAMPWLGAGKQPAPTATKARLLWDRDFLYFHAEMQDRDVYAAETNQDGAIWLGDVFEVFLKPAKDKKGYYEFEFNPANAKLDMYLPSRGAGGYNRFKSDGEFHLESQVRVDGSLNHYLDVDKGWSVEGRIPWKDFARTGGRPEPGEEWTFALCRYDYSVGMDEPSLSTTAPLKQADFHRFEDYSPLRFVGPAALPRVAWNSSKVVGSPEPPAPYRAVAEFPNLKVQAPVNIYALPGTEELLLVELVRSGTNVSRVRQFANRADVTDAPVVLAVPETAYGLAFHPGFATNGLVYLGGNGPGAKGAKYSRVVRYQTERGTPWRFDLKSRVVIIEWLSDGHNGADLCFGNDGMLYVTSGDGTSDSDMGAVGQDLSQLTAKVLRIDVDRPAEGKLYSVPRDNPFVGQAGVRPETWAYGLRNPWKISADRESGQIWVGENGQDVWEMARLLERGANYGWSVYEGSQPFYLSRKLGPQPLTKPTLEHHHSEARSLTGGVVYRGAKLPGLRGAYIYGDYSTGKIWGARHDGKRVTWHQELTDTPYAIAGFGLDAQGELLVLDHGGGIYRLEATPPVTNAPVFPRKLSETGVFTSTKAGKAEAGLIPYSVNSPLWSDGAHKERWLGLPGETKIGFTHNRAFDFPEGTVLVKEFALDLVAGDAASRRRLETRLLTKQAGEWVGYTYLWNEEQTDAVLLGAAGEDREFTVRDAAAAGGERKVKWHFPSRTECMVCHSRAAKYVLGLTEAQLNRTHDYGGGRVENQLEHLERLGILTINPQVYERDAVRRELSATGLKGEKLDVAVKRVSAHPGQRGLADKSTLLPRGGVGLRKLADPADATASLEARARSYLQANCAHCHVAAGGGNAQIELEFLTERAAMKLIDEKPLHHTFGIAEARLVAPGAPERSVLLHRIANREAGHMPPLATGVVDAMAVKLFREWIAEMKAGGEKAEK